MMESKQTLIGLLFATLAALANATIGLFTNVGMDLLMAPNKIAFYRCIIALAATTLYLLLTRKFEKITIHKFFKISLCALFGIFTLYFFETLSYQYTKISNVTFLLMGTSAVATCLLGKLFFGEKLNRVRVLGLIIVLLGIFFMLYTKHLELGNLIGNSFAVIAGLGYALFLLLTRKFKIKSTMNMLWYFFLAGSIYLSIPCFINSDFYIPFNGLPSLTVLGIIPTLGGFYFTTKALHYIEANRTQLFEMSEPLFASLLGFCFLQQHMSIWQVLGGLFILFGLCVAENQFSRMLRYKRKATDTKNEAIQI